MNILTTKDKISLHPHQILNAANYFFKQFYVTYLNRDILFINSFSVKNKFNCFEKSHHEKKYLNYRIIINLINFLIKTNPRNVSATRNHVKCTSYVEGNIPTYITTNHISRKNSTMERKESVEKKSNKEKNEKVVDGEKTKLDQDHDQVTQDYNIGDTSTDIQCYFPEKEPAFHLWHKQKNIHHYNIDPSARTKKIQIYYNCEMIDMERKIYKIKKVLRNGNPVDILLICSNDNRAKKRAKREKKKNIINKQDYESTSEDEHITKFPVKNKSAHFAELKKLNESKYSTHINVKINFLLNHLEKISTVDEIFRHVKNGKYVILMKVYPR
ncbi:hypothetical protein, conserved [Plasmodium gonderi]|uniref:Uncharacterized protein n=1 Tax=Plasmodium gonderi TaxID=77519 RepID=A0A1Y1JC27_PLAGO|nr:hypothetical protein, conserved [Plasmodium gonderi]GAW80046.1 hypothetical protein, conserved [Plasmodium gonderi]